MVAPILTLNCRPAPHPVVVHGKAGIAGGGTELLAKEICGHACSLVQQALTAIRLLWR